MTMLDAYLWPLHATKAWFDFLRLAPQALVQPILPGWNFGNIYNVSEENSSSPQTEQEVLRRHSYGRQLGRVIDALSVIVDELDSARLSAAQQRSLAEFTSLAREIEGIKEQETIKRFERIAGELGKLKETDSPLYPRAIQLLEPYLRA